MARSSGSTIDVINSPNTAGAACGYSAGTVTVSPGQSTQGLPFFEPTQFYKIPPFTYSASASSTCLTLGFTAPSLNAGCSLASNAPDSVSWDFGDPASGGNNVSSGNNPSHQFTQVGTYTVSMMLHYNCRTDTIRQSVLVSQPCISVSSQSITCASLGSATAQVTGAPGPFTYTWLPGGQTGSVASNMIPGTHTILINDSGNGMTYSKTVVFVPLIPLTGNIAASSGLSCPGAATGTGQVTNLAGGSGSEFYSWTNGITTFTTPSVNSLSAGIWTVTVTDVLTACQISQVFQVTQPPALLLNISANTNTACAGSSIVLTGTTSGGTPGYTYSWSNGPPSNSNTVIEISSGSFVYSLTATDANTCSITSTIAVDFVPNPTVTVPLAHACPFQSATLTASGATSYTWQGGANGNTLVVAGIATGSQQFSVVGSALGCTASAMALVMIKQPPPVQIISNSPLCEGNNLNLQGFGGGTYVWDGPLSFSSALANPKISNAQPAHSGVYNVTVTGVNGCTASTSGTVVVHPTPTVSATGATLCSSETLLLSAGSVTNASFLWSGPLSFTSNVQNPVISQPPVAATGNYSVIATSSEGCTNTAVAHVSVVTPPSLSVALSSTSLCAQAFNGSPNTITLTSSGADTYTLVTSSPLVTTDANSPTSSLTTNPPYQPAGLSTATLYGSNGICTVSMATTFSIVSNPSVTINSFTPVICAGESFTYTSHGADSYVWTSSTPNFTTWNNGGIAVTDPNVQSVFSVYGSSLGCNSALKTATITVNPIPTLTVTPLNGQVCRYSSAALTVSGTAQSYTWFPQLELNTATGEQVIATPSEDMTYTVVGSALGCTNSATAFIEVLELPVPKITTSKAAYCKDEPAILSASGAKEYLWRGPDGSQYEGSSVSFDLLSPGVVEQFTVIATDSNECVGIATKEVSVHPVPGGFLTGKMEGCEPLCGRYFFYGGGNSSDWFVSGSRKHEAEEAGGFLLAAKNATAFNWCFKQKGEYLIKGNITDGNTKCKATQHYTVHVYEKPKADFTWLPEKPVAGIENVLLLNNSTGSSQTQWNWHMEQDRLFRPTTENAEYFFANEGKYPIVYVVENKWNCADTIIKVLEIESDFVFYMPNAFTPNADSRNEVFKPVVQGIKKYQMQVFNRWGERIFVSNDPNEGWDGTFREQNCKQDSYAWKVVMTTNSGSIVERSGSVVLLK